MPTILLRRGTDAERLGITLAEGEPYQTTDTKLLYVGDGITQGGILVGDIDHNHDLDYSDINHNHDADYQPAGTYNTIIGTDSDINTSGATIIDALTMTDGVITSHATRTLTPNDIGAAASNHTHNHLASKDDRDMKPNTSGIGAGEQGVRAFFSSLGGMTGSADSDYQDVFVLDTWSDGSGGKANALTFDKSEHKVKLWQAGQAETSWGTPSTFAFLEGANTWTDNNYFNKSIQISKSSGTMLSWTGVADAIGLNPSYGTYIGHGANYLYSGSDTKEPSVYRYGSRYNLWHAGNDGAGSGLDADKLDGIHASGFLQLSDRTLLTPYHSGRNFVNGTLIETSITSGAWTAELLWHTYSSHTVPVTLKMKGYIYGGSVGYASGGYSTSLIPSQITCFLLNGKLAIWIPRMGYWQSYSATVLYAHGSSGVALNKVTNISDVAQPTSGVTQLAEYTPVMKAHATLQESQTWTGTNTFNTTLKVPTGGINIIANTDGDNILGWNVGKGAWIRGVGDTTGVYGGDGTHPYYYNGAMRKIWHEGNDGSGSGLDADKLDGVEGSAFGKLANSQTWTGTNTFFAPVRASSFVRADGATMWHSGNDGSGSGLDADLLDGYDSGAFGKINANNKWTAVNHSLGTMRHCVSFNNTSTPSNGYQINTNITRGDGGTMSKIRVHGYSYSGGEVIDFTVVFYTYSGSFTSYSYVNNGAYDPGTVTLGTDANGKVVLHWTNTRYYARFAVEHFAKGMNQDSTMSNFEGWTVTSGITAPTLTPVTVLPKAISSSVLVGNGTQSAPSMSFASDTNLGFFRYGGDQIGVSCGDDRQLRFTSGTYGITMDSDLHMNNRAINYISQLHFNDNVRFYDEGNDSYLNFKYGDTNAGGIRVRNGNSELQGYIYADSSGFGLLNGEGQWGIRTTTDSTFLYCDGVQRLHTRDAGVYVTGGVTATVEVEAPTLGVTNSSSGSGKGISLYGGASSGKPTYGLMFAGTPAFGTHGGVTGDWATYFTMNDSGTTRGWIFQRGANNVASIDGEGDLYARQIHDSGSRVYSAANKPSYSDLGFARVQGRVVSDCNHASFRVPGMYGFNNNPTNGTGESYGAMIVAANSDTGLQIAGGYSNDDLYFRGWWSSGAGYGTWRRLLHAGNYNSYAPTKTGGGASGSWGISVTGNAATATWADTVDVNTSTSGSFYNMNWHSGDTLYSCSSGGGMTYRPSDGFTEIKHGYLAGTRLTHNTDGKVYANNTGYRRAGMYGTYDSTKVGHIWSMGTGYVIDNNGATFGNLYGLAYKHTNNTTGGTMAGGHQMVWCQNGTGYAAMGSNIWTSGNVTAYSDRRVKENIETIPNALDKISKVGGYTFDRTDIEMPRQTGVIAQEILEILPEAVTGGPTEEAPENHYSVAYGNLVGLLIEGIKELTAKVEDLERRVN